MGPPAQIPSLAAVSIAFYDNGPKLFGPRPQFLRRESIANQPFGSPAHPRWPETQSLLWRHFPSASLIAARALSSHTKVIPLCLGLSVISIVRPRNASSTASNASSLRLFST